MENTQKYFISDIRYDLPTVREYSACMLPARRKWITALLVAYTAGYVAVYAVRNPQLLMWVCAVCLIALGILTLRNRDGGKGYQKLLEQMGGVPRRNLVYIRDEGIRYRNLESENIVELDYRDITGITRTRSFFILTMADGQRTLLSHAKLTGGTAEELERWLLERTGVQKVSRVVDGRIFKKLLIGIFAVGLALGLVLEGGVLTPRPKAMTASGAAQVLTELGIQVPETDIGDDFVDEYMVVELLCWAGMGEYDPDTFAWTPASSGVYAFDLEVFDVGNMYTDFLRGVEALSGGELVFTDVVEDETHVNLDEGTGWKEITFTFNGQTHTIRAEMMSDWFDPSFADAIAELTADADKQLRFHFDGYQMACVFWCDDAWAREFTRATGLALTDTLC